MTKREHLDLFAAEFRRLMRASPWNQSQVADRLGVRASAVSRWASGISVPTWDNVQGIAALFEVDAEELWRLVTFRAKDASALHATHTPAEDEPDVAAEIVVGARLLSEALRDVPRPMWSTYIDACLAMGRTMRDAFSKVNEPTVSRGEPENDDPPETHPKGPRNRPLAAPVPALANC